VVFGVTYSGRPPALPGVERMVGLFVNTLPARVRISRDQPVGSWLSGLLREQVQAREYEHTPLDQVKSWTAVPPDRPLFESIQGLENYPMTGSRFRTGSVAIREIDTFEQTNYPLSFLAIPDEQLWLQLWYDALRFTPATAEAVLRMAEALVRELAADPDRTVGEVLALVAARHRPPRRPEPPDLPVPQLVAYWAGVAPDRTAVRSGGARLTYRQLDRRANQVAHALRDAGAGPGTRVGLALPPDVDRVAAMLGILKAGAVCVPLPDGAAAGPAPATGLLVVPDRTGPPPGGWPGGGPAVALGPGERAEPPEARPGPTDPAVVAWWRAEASVSAVELSHGELARQVRAWRDEITGQDVVAQHAEPASDVAAWEVWTALGTGACLALDRSAATVLTATPDEVSELLDRDPVALAPVRRLLVRGELPAPAARRLRLAHPSLQVRPAAGIAARRVAQVLRQLPMVREVVVTPAPDGRQLAAYLVPDAAALDRAGSGAGAGGRLADQHVGYWRTLYDRTYAGRAPADPEFDIVGWRSSYTGGPIADPAMAEWRDRTVERIRALRPARVLEIGCGTGLLLFGLLAGCGQYVGTDFSPVCLAQLRAQLATRDAATRAKVTLLERTGDDLAGLPPGGFDVVVLNSVVQYFPGPDYLARVLDAAVRAAAPAGAVFVGDVRHHGLAEAFQVSVELHRAVDMLPTDELSGRVGRSLAQERELLVDPGYFRALAAARPEIGAVQVLPKRGRHDTELTRYRYDAVLRLGAHPPGPDPVAWYDWRRDVLSRSEIGWLLEHADGDAVGVTGVPNARIAADLEAARLLAGTDPPATAGELRLAAGKAPAGVDPEELYQLGEGCGWTVAVSWAGSDVGGVDVLFRRGSGAGAGTLPPPAGAASPAPAPVGSRLTNAPLRAALAGELERQAWQALPADAPVRWVRVLDELPRTADGQPDEAALPVPEDDHPAGPAATGAVPPRTADELRLALVWERLLGVSPVDVRTSFFDLGGDSLLAIRAVDEASRSLGREIPMAVLLQEPTVEGMAAALRADPAAWNPLVEVTPGAGAPFFCVHPAGGGVLCYAELARLLAPRPFCALQARGVDDRHPPYQDLPGMAARYLQAVRGRQPTGPYLLGGYSLGGLVAYEMAQQLVRAGERVARLVLVDTPTPDLVADLPDEAAGLARLLAGRAALDPDELRAMPARERLRQLLAAAERARLVPPGMDPDRAQQLYEVYTAHLAAARAYRPQPFGGPTCLVRAGQSDRAAAGHQWGRLLTGPAEVVEVPGDHETVIWPPHVRRLAEVLRGQLAAAQA
jgi:thioesterase domain-containing protein/SAM-dependent methyltransferase/acyl carrier protein